ncbi:MAG: type II secretion system protein [Fusobacteriaceae bacterium]
MRGKRRGFTLIELVVTVAIIGVLATVLIAKMTKSIANAKDVRALSSVTALRKASLLYFNEQEKSFSAVSDDGDITGTDIRNLVNSGYLESRALKAFIKSGETNASIEVGSMGTESDCEVISTKGYIPLKLENDGVDIAFDTETYDSNCKEWKNK